MADDPVLKIRATGVGSMDVTEVSLNGQPIYPLSIDLRMADGELTRATMMVLDVIPDIETPAVQMAPLCWHTEAGTPCDADGCRQPERLAAGDRGTDPAEE